MSFLQKVEAWGKRLVPQKPVDPSVFDDPIATRTQWTPLKHGGSSFGTHRLVQIDPRRLELRKSGASILFGSAFLGAGVFIACAYAWVQQSWAYALLSLPFIAGGLFAV